MKWWIYVVVAVSSAAVASLLTVGLPRFTSGLEKKGQCWSVERSTRRSERDPVVRWVEG